MDDGAARWFLSREERGNPASDAHAGGDGSSSWSEGNLVRPLVHGSAYFARLHEELTGLRYPMIDSIAWEAMEERHGLIIANLDEQSGVFLHLRAAVPVSQVMAVPLIGETGARGALTAGRGADDRDEEQAHGERTGVGCCLRAGRDAASTPIEPRPTT